MSKPIWEGLQGWKKYLSIYLVLLVLSHLVVWIFENPIHKQKDDFLKVSIPSALQGDSISSDTLIIEYEDIYEGTASNPPTILLMPGGPEGASVFKALVPRLSSDFRLIIPHLPGDNTIETQLPDYSFKSLAVYTNRLLEKLQLSNVNIVGYGLGGADSIYLSHDFPEKVKSLTLISSVGVQELQLLGSHTLNHAVYGIQLGVVWFLHNAIPHFGLFDVLDINVPYAKSYFDSDQRPLRSYLKQFQKPVLILHGRNDALVPLAAAKEHRRIVPQSTLKLYNADHDLVETHSDSLTMAIAPFIKEVEQGMAITQNTASRDRIAEAKKSFKNIDFAKLKGASLYVLMLIIILGTLLSEDLTCIGSGLLVARGLIGFWPATLACLIGIFAGDIALYMAGRLLGRPAISKVPLKWFISENDLKKSAKWFDDRGPVIIFITRFLPGSRMPTYISAGIIRAKFWMFASYFLLAAMVWTPMLVGISKLLGNELVRYFDTYENYALWVFAGAVLAILFILKVIVPAFSFKGRRMLLSRCRKLVHWEYWSPIILYLPVTVYVIFLGIKNRCMTLFTAANPAIPDGGFIGESKTEILQLFDCNGQVADFDCISSELDTDQKMDKAQKFMEKHELSFPIVLKPDVGQRGKGVEIIRKGDQMRTYLEKAETDTIIQQYIDGEEFGIFYYKDPGKSDGNIFSITTKKLLCIQGDGEKTLEELILQDDQAVSLAKFHLKENEDRLMNVPGEEEKVCIVELGTHARGALFEDGTNYVTPELLETMNAFCDAAPGFYFGRFDIKVPATEKLKSGEKLKIIEVNGVTSESTNIYDAKYSFWDAQKILMKQWRLAFEIGEANRMNGAEVASFSLFLKRMFTSLLNA